MLKQVPQDKASPKQLIKVFDQSDSPVKIVHDETNQSVSVQKANQTTLLNWNKFEIEVGLRLANPKILSNCLELQSVS